MHRSSSSALAFVLLAASSLAVPARADAASWQLDPSHSNVGFSIRHMMVSNVRGNFAEFGGTVTGDPSNPGAAVIEATIDAASIDTGDEKRDAHLRNADFLDVEKYPTITFKSKKIEAAGAGKAKVTGDLTLHGVTKEVVLDVEGPSAPIKDPYGNTRAGASATTKIDRKDFGITWSKSMDGGGLVVGDEITITIDVEAVQKK
ncbi:MAG: YceI family protein [Deltaproteobacteria bacterium]|nr:YceI family protein [Deltaproteobacteria bacterium]